jgi:hypothetical protein
MSIVGFGAGAVVARARVQVNFFVFASLEQRYWELLITVDFPTVLQTDPGLIGAAAMLVIADPARSAKTLTEIIPARLAAWPKKNFIVLRFHDRTCHKNHLLSD